MGQKDITIVRATILSVMVAIIIVLAKFVGWYYTDSLTILASVTDSLLDIAASFVNFIAARYALQPPDNEHRFGHGKAEDLAVFTQSAFFSLSGIFILGVSVRRLIFPAPLEHGKFGIIVIIFSIIMTIFLIMYQTYAYKKTRSQIVKADRLHYSVDLFSNMAVIVSLSLSEYFNSEYIDPIFASLIAIYMLVSAIRLINNAFKNLMDHEMEEEHRSKIKKIIMSNKRVRGFHDLKTRYSGRKAVIQFHIELDGKMPLNEAHKIAERIESKICHSFKGADVIIHQDPAELDEEVEFVS